MQSLVEVAKGKQVQANPGTRSHNFLTMSIQRAKIKQQDLCNEFARLCSGLGCKFRKESVKAKRRSKNPEAFS